MEDTRELEFIPCDNCSGPAINLTIDRGMPIFKCDICASPGHLVVIPGPPAHPLRLFASVPGINL